MRSLGIPSRCSVMELRRASASQKTVVVLLVQHSKGSQRSRKSRLCASAHHSQVRLARNEVAPPFCSRDEMGLNMRRRTNLGAQNQQTSVKRGQKQVSACLLSYVTIRSFAFSSRAFLMMDSHSSLLVPRR